MEEIEFKGENYEIMFLPDVYKKIKRFIEITYPNERKEEGFCFRTEMENHNQDHSGLIERLVYIDYNNDDYNCPNSFSVDIIIHRDIDYSVHFNYINSHGDRYLNFKIINYTFFRKEYQPQDVWIPLYEHYETSIKSFLKKMGLLKKKILYRLR